MWALKTLIAVVLFIDSFLSSFLQVSISGRELFFSHRPTYQDSTGLVVSARCTGASILSQAKMYRPECSAQVALTAKESTFASQHLDRLEVTDMLQEPICTIKAEMAEE